MATYVIGDLQGCFTALQRLLALIDFRPGRDRLWFTGDLVNRGPESLACLRAIKNLGASAQIVLGNHDLHLLAVAAGKEALQRGDTLQDILTAPDRDELIDWLRYQPLLHYEAPYLLVHAGLLPNWTVEQARFLAQEVEAQLRSPDWMGFLSHLYGNEPDAWTDELVGEDRWRVIVNGLTRLRYCSPAGVMNFSAKGRPFDESGTAIGPAGFLPWFLLPERRSGAATILCGHWSLLGLQILPNVITLDTGCVWGGPLTAIRLEDRRVYQVFGQDRKPREENLENPIF